MTTKPSHLAFSGLLAGALLGAAALPAGAAVSSVPSVAHKQVAVGRSTHRKDVHRTVTRKVGHKPVAAAKANLTSFESALLTDINNARHAVGEGSLVAAPGMTDVARRWTLTLVRNAALSHNPNLVRNAQAAGSSAWTWLGENVGTGPANDEAGLFKAYMASPHHRDNILDPRGTFIGIGVVQTTDAEGDQVAYNTCDFTNAYSSSYGIDKTPALSAVLTVDAATSALAG